MAGHSHSANIKHKKALVDSKRGKVWTKCAKAIIVAAKMGGGEPDHNVRLRYAIDDAKAANMPKDTIERAIKKGTGELEGGQLDQVMYEGYGPGGAAIMCDILTDNRNRTAPEIRKIFEVNGGKLGATGCVGWMFQRKGVFLVPAQGTSEDSLMELALEAGADDVNQSGDSFEITCEPTAYEDVAAALAAAKIEIEAKELTYIPGNRVDLSPEDTQTAVQLLEKLDDHDDVQNVYANFNAEAE